jgi:hypothetical protein
MAGRKNFQTRKMLSGRGSKHCWQDNTANEPADSTTRLRARCHNQKVIANEINLAFTTANVQKMLTGRPTY